MQQLTADRAEIEIAAPREIVFTLVTDLDRMVEFSPELESCHWLEGATGPAVGARFEAVNSTGRRPWRNRPVVTAYEPPTTYAVSRTEPLAGTVVWRYDLTPTDGGTRVTESYEVTRPVSRLGWFVIERMYGGHDRAAALAEGMAQTLARLKDAAERSAR